MRRIVAAALVITPTLAVSTLVGAEPPPPSGTVTVSPAAVNPGDLVTVTGVGFRPGATVALYQCAAGATELLSCQSAGTTTTVNEFGSLQASIAVEASITPPSGRPVDCFPADAARACAIGVADVLDFPGTFASATLVSYDPDLVPTLIQPGVANGAEGSSGTTDLLVPVTLSHATGVPVTASWRVIQPAGAPGHQATPVEDYTPTNGTVTFSPGQTSTTVTISIVGDTTVEPDEYVVLSFSDPVNAGIGGYWGLGFAMARNDD